MSDVLKEKVKKLPRSPGIYKFLDKNERIIYVGKAIDLKSRVGSYFSVKLDPGSKTYILVSEIRDIAYIETESEIEALVLEAELIKKYKPRFNINLKDNKSFLYIVVRPEKKEVRGRLRTLSSVFILRKQDLEKGDTYFGPFPSSRITRSVVRTLRKVFPHKDCSPSKFTRYRKVQKTCLYGHIGLCTGPCVNDDNTEIREYQSYINKIKKFLGGDTSSLIQGVVKQMNAASKSLKYEKAAFYRDLLEKFNYIRQSFRTPREYMENPYLKYDLAEDAVEELREVLPTLHKLPERIECYDISTISGDSSVGSMVVALMGNLDTTEYRRFRIKTKNTPDDFEMMREVLSRRLKRERSRSKNVKKWGLPDLIVVDGGKGQVSAVREILSWLNFDICVIGLAKKNETVIYYENGQYRCLSPNRDAKPMKLLIKLRDESHRFAQSYHHLLRKKSLRE
ncbi:GIY-YIG nuclease family protein [Patescibacteria group bacterium]|nr:GIY-YIG nuclease family protein [Patescibacteria group bacterium]